MKVYKASPNSKYLLIRVQDFKEMSQNIHKKLKLLGLDGDVPAEDGSNLLIFNLKWYK